MDPITQKILDQQMAISQDPNFSLYQPSDMTQPSSFNEPVGIAPLIDEKTTMPDFKKAAINFAKNKALNYAADQIGLNTAQASGLATILGIGSNMFAPLSAISALTGRSLGISDYLNNKRAQKEMKRQQTMRDAAIITNRIQRQTTPQDIIDDRGRGQIGSKSTTSSPKSMDVSNPYSGGIGGIQSGL